MGNGIFGTSSCTRACAPQAWLINYAPLELRIRFNPEGNMSRVATTDLLARDFNLWKLGGILIFDVVP